MTCLAMVVGGHGGFDGGRDIFSNRGGDTGNGDGNLSNGDGWCLWLML